jgi:hypothetical protein
MLLLWCSVGSRLLITTPSWRLRQSPAPSLTLNGLALQLQLPICWVLRSPLWWKVLLTAAAPARSLAEVSGGCICTEQDAKNMNLDGPPSPSHHIILTLYYQVDFSSEPYHDHKVTSFHDQAMVISAFASACSFVRKVRPCSASLLTCTSGIIFQTTTAQWLPNSLEPPKSPP